MREDHNETSLWFLDSGRWSLFGTVRICGTLNLIPPELAGEELYKSSPCLNECRMWNKSTGWCKSVELHCHSLSVLQFQCNTRIGKRFKAKNVTVFSFLLPPPLKQLLLLQKLWERCGPQRGTCTSSPTENCQQPPLRHSRFTEQRAAEHCPATEKKTGCREPGCPGTSGHCCGHCYCHWRGEGIRSRNWSGNQGRM